MLFNKSYVPPVGFFYTLNIIDPQNSLYIPSPLDAGFQEVSGINVTFETEQIKEGGENRFSHTVPKGNVNYDDLVLKRGVVTSGSVLSAWCQAHLINGLNSPIKPMILTLKLLDASTKLPMMVWIFYNAYPVKWEVSGFNAENSQILVETLTFNYNFFNVMGIPKLF